MPTAAHEREPTDARVTIDALDRDPYPIYRRLRDESPVCWVPAVSAWLVTSWAAGTHVAANPQAFGAPSDSPLRRTLGENVITVDAHAHARLRSAMEPRLHRTSVAEYAPELVRRIAQEQWKQVAGRTAVELMGEFFEPIAVRALAEVMGIGDLDVAVLRRWFGELAAGGGNYERDPSKDALSARASREIEEVIRPRLDMWRRDPQANLISDLLSARSPEGPLTDEEVMANVKLLLLGGMQEPGHAAGNILWALLEHPEQLRAVAQEPDLVEAAMEEGLRWLAPVGTATREVRGETVLEGTPLRAGDRIAVVLSSLNRDERRFADGERFDITRQSKHRAFGIGAHFCVGHWLARWEIRTPLRLLVERAPGLRFDPDRPSQLRGWEFRGPLALHARWDAA
jgi:cytochrome P450